MVAGNPNHEQRKARFLTFRRNLYKYLTIACAGIAAVFTLLIVVTNSGMYHTLYIGLVLLSVLSCLKFGWLWRFSGQEKLHVDIEIRETRKKMNILSICLVIAFASCVAFLFVLEWRNYLFISIPLTLWLGGEFVALGVDYFQLCILEDELRR